MASFSFHFAILALTPDILVFDIILCISLTKAVECRNGHWVHYNCEKLNDEDIQKVRKKDAIYTCTICTSISDKKKTTLAIAKRSEEYSKAHKLTLAEDYPHSLYVVVIFPS
jgi:hypothetical protein